MGSMQERPGDWPETRITREASDDFVPTRRSLLTRLKQWDDREGWREFFDTYGRLLYGLARKSGLNDAESQDVVQETLIAVAKQIPGFHYNPALGSFKGWLFQIARRRIADQFRKRLPRARPHRGEWTEDRTATVEDIPDLSGLDAEAVWDRHWQESLLELAIARLKRRVSPKQFQMFDLYALQEWPMRAVTETLGVSRAQVYMAKMRLGRLLKQEAENLRDGGT